MSRRSAAMSCARCWSTCKAYGDEAKMMKMRGAITCVLVALTAVACERAGQNQRAETQPGAALDQSRGTQAGAAPASCKRLPSADDLKKWLRQAPGEGGETGGVVSGETMGAPR